MVLFLKVLIFSHFFLNNKLISENDACKSKLNNYSSKNTNNNNKEDTLKRKRTELNSKKYNFKKIKKGKLYKYNNSIVIF